MYDEIQERTKASIARETAGDNDHVIDVDKIIESIESLKKIALQPSQKYLFSDPVTSVKTITSTLTTPVLIPFEGPANALSWKNEISNDSDEIRKVLAVLILCQMYHKVQEKIKTDFLQMKKTPWIQQAWWSRTGSH